MSETTSKPSIWFYDNVRFNYMSGYLFPSSYSQYLIVDLDGRLYAVSGNHISLRDSGVSLGYGYETVQYHPDTGLWGQPNLLSDSVYLETQIDDGFLACDVLCQNLDQSKIRFFSSEQFRSGNINAPTGSIIDSIYTSSPLDGVIAVLPVILIVLVGFFGIRKGISFVISRLRGV